MSDNMLREKIAEILAPHIGAFGDEIEDMLPLADRILALPEIAEALRHRAGFAATAEDYARFVVDGQTPFGSESPLR